MIDRPLVFLGTPEPAAIVLEALVADGRNVMRVVTGHDKRRGRGSSTSPTPVKAVAQRCSIPVDHDLTWLEEDLPDGLLGIVVAYGRIIPASVLHRVPMWNVHFSLLPRWRGAAPVARAILAGDEETGVCIMEMDEGLDTGGILASAATPIRVSDTSDSLTERLACMGSELLVAVLDSANATPSAQVGESTYAHKIDPSERQIDWRAGSQEIDRKVRALRAHTVADGMRIAILETETVDSSSLSNLLPGAVSADGHVRTGDGAIRLVRVQPAGRGPQPASEWLRGWRSGTRRFDLPES